MLLTPIVHYLVIGRDKEPCNAPGFIALDTLKEREAIDKCRELNEANPTQSYTLQTWTKVR